MTPRQTDVGGEGNVPSVPGQSVSPGGPEPNPPELDAAGLEAAAKVLAFRDLAADPDWAGVYEEEWAAQPEEYREAWREDAREVLDPYLAAVSRPVPVDEPACDCREAFHRLDCPQNRPPVVPVDDEPRNPYRTLHARMSPPGAAWDEGFAAGRGAERERIVAALEADYRANVADGADGIYTDGLHDAWRLTVRRAKRDDLIKPVSGSSEPRKETT